MSILQLNRYPLLKPYIGNEKMLTSPFAHKAGRAWAMNKHLDGWKITDINHPHRTVLIFEARLDSPPAGGHELLPESPRVRRGYIIGFVDDHPEYVRPERLDELIWTPETRPSEIVRWAQTKRPNKSNFC